MTSGLHPAFNTFPTLGGQTNMAAVLRTLARYPDRIAFAWPGAQPSVDALIDLVKQRKGLAYAPRHIKFATELPMTGVGKVDKKVLKAGFRAGRDRLVG